MPDTEYTKILNHFEKLFEAYQNVEPYLSKDDLPDHFKSYVRDKESWINRLKSSEFPVAFFGGFDAGKSTVINAILGRSILPEAAKSLTAVPTHVKKGKKDCAVIHYLGKKEKQELRELYIREICGDDGLNKNAQEISELVNLNDQKLIETLDSDITKVVKTLKTGLGFIQGTSFGKLKTLITKGNAFNGESKEISLSEIEDYVTERNPDSLFIDKVEVFLSETNITEEGVVLVDLPGLGVVNPRHKKITEYFVKKEAKALVVTGLHLHLLEGDEIRLLAQLNQQMPKVLERAFWVINQWDIAGEEARKEVNKNFDAKVKEHQFNVNRGRIFRVTALNYLLLKLIADKKQDSALDKHRDVLVRFVKNFPTPERAKELINSIDEVRDFDRLKKDLVAYLKETAKKEFLEEARNACLDLSSKLCDILEPLQKSDENEEELKQNMITRQVAKDSEQVLNEVTTIVTEQAKTIRTEKLSKDNFVFWTDQNQKEFEDEIRRLVDELDRQNLLNVLCKGPYREIVWAPLPSELEKNLPIAEMFGKRLQTLMKENVVMKFSQTLLGELKKSRSLPEIVSKQLDDRLSQRDMSSRLKGICDVVLFDYGKTIDEAGLKVATAQQQADKRDAQTNEERIVSALNSYKEKLIVFTKQQQEAINKYTRSSIKNYFDELERELVQLFKEKSSEFAIVVRKEVISNLEEELGLELKKQAAVNKAYKTLADVRTSCQ